MNNCPEVLDFQGLRGFSCFCGIHMPLRRISANYERVKRAFGPEQVEAVEAAKQRKQAKKERRRKTKRKFTLSFEPNEGHPPVSLRRSEH